MTPNTTSSPPTFTKHSADLLSLVLTKETLGDSHPPEFTPILSQIILSTYAPPNLPPALYKLTLPKTLNLTPSLASSSQSSSSGSANTASSGHFNVSGLTLPTFGRPSANPSQGQQFSNAKIKNLTPDHALGRLIPQSVKIRDLISTSPPPPLPVLDDNTQICLSYHIRHSCWSNCKQAHAHCRTLSSAKRARLEQYVWQQLVVYAAQHSSNQGAAPSVPRGLPHGAPQGTPSTPSSS